MKTKRSIDSLMDEMQPVLLRRKKFDSQEKSKTSAFTGYFRLQFPCKKRFPKKHF